MSLIRKEEFYQTHIENEEKQSRYLSENIDKILQSDSYYAGDLISLDFKSESLQKFLGTVVNLVNQHSQRINQLEIEKIAIQRITNGNEKLMESGKLGQTILNTLPSLPNKSKIENYEDTIEVISNNMKLNSHCNFEVNLAIQYIYDNLKKKDENINVINSQLASFQKKDESSDGVKRAIEMSKKYTDDEANKYLTRLKELEMKMNKKMGDYENSLKDTEKKTLWKINECESGLLKKITPDYVEKAMEQLELKIHNDIKINKNQELNEMKFGVETLKSRVDSLNKEVREQDKENKNVLKDLEENMKITERKDVAEQGKREFDQRIKELLIKIDRLEKREDPQEVEMRLIKSVAEHHEKIETHHDKIKKLENQLESINNVMSSMSVESGGMDPHKLCHIDGEVRRLRDTSRTNETKLDYLENEVKTKLLVFEERIITTLGALKGQDNYVSREELYESLSRLREPVTEKMNENQSLINELHAKITKLELFEKATKRKIKDLTKGDELNKILDMKMGIDQAETNFGSINMKLENLEIIFNKMKMEAESNNAFLDHLQKSMNETEEGFNILGPKQKVFPAKCLGCGFKHNPVHENNMMMGSDGKYYKVDMRNNYTDPKEVYGVTASQVAMYDSSSNMKRMMGTTRPTSSKTNSNMRPNSAHKYM